MSVTNARLGNSTKHSRIPTKITLIKRRRTDCFDEMVAVRNRKDMGAAHGRQHEVPLERDGRQPTHAWSIV